MGAMRPQEGGRHGRVGLPPDSDLPALTGGPIAARLRCAAVQIVGTHGIEALTDTALAARAETSIAALRRRFGSAMGCFELAYEALLDDFFTIWEAAFADHEDFNEALMASVVGVVEHTAQHPDRARVVFCEVLRGGHELRARRDARRAAHVEWLEQEYAARRSVVPSATQLELLSGALFHMLRQHVEAGTVHDVETLRVDVLGVVAVFEPAIAA